ncbi:MAG: ADP-ribosyl-(dinitrogen reductase) glycohydrolase [Bacteroidetes bacterium ADurb.Bin174]|nr:MAG: ADP-ribosyl-(dinitrogen reductase) glycohydrolase [Bacteroidetes bacterium ADurb.Bin174]
MKPELAGGTNETMNGNGSLMRILPLVFYLLDKPVKERFEITRLVSSITHRHIRSVIACFYYLEFARKIIQGEEKFEIYKSFQTEISSFLVEESIQADEISIFDRLLQQNIFELSEDNIFSSGYVLDTLEAAIWCLLTTNSYSEAVLKAINLGNDTDTTGAVTGGLAGLLYGINNIPEKWLHQLARYDEIEDLANRLSIKIIS